MTYFRTGNPYYHRRAAVSRSCSGWEGVGPAGYGRQALTGVRSRQSEVSQGARAMRASSLGDPAAWLVCLRCLERLTSVHRLPTEKVRRGLSRIGASVASHRLLFKTSVL